MSKDSDVNFTEDRIFCIGMGLIYCCVCAPKDWDGEKVAADVTREYPPGTSNNRWVVTGDISHFEDQLDEDKRSNPHQCPDCESRQHWILNC